MTGFLFLEVLTRWIWQYVSYFGNTENHDACVGSALLITHSEYFETELKGEGPLVKQVCVQKSLLWVWIADMPVVLFVCKWFWLILLLSNTLGIFFFFLVWFCFLISYHSFATLKSLEIILTNAMEWLLRKMSSNCCKDFSRTLYSKTLSSRMIFLVFSNTYYLTVTLNYQSLNFDSILKKSFCLYYILQWQSLESQYHPRSNSLFNLG